MPGKLKALLTGAIVPLVVLALWEACSRAGFFSPIVLPAPSAVAVRWWAYLTPMEPWSPNTQSWLAWALSGELPGDAAGSLYRVLVVLPLAPA